MRISDWSSDVCSSDLPVGIDRPVWRCAYDLRIGVARPAGQFGLRLGDLGFDVAATVGEFGPEPARLEPLRRPCAPRGDPGTDRARERVDAIDRKSTRLNSSH